MCELLPRCGLDVQDICEPDLDEREPRASIVSLMLGVLFVAICVVIVGFGAAYFLEGVGLAMFLPAWRDHHTDARQEWIAEQGQGPTTVERWTFRLCAVAFAVLLVSGYWFGGAA